jgi:hypothetical protein
MFLYFSKFAVHATVKKKQELNFLLISISSTKELISILKLRLTELNCRLGLLTPGLESFLRINVSYIDWEISPLLCNPNIHCHCHNSQPLNPILSHPTVENALKACFCETYFSIICHLRWELVNHLLFSGFQIVILRTFVVSNFHTTLSVYFKFHNFNTLKIHTADLVGSAAG